VFAITPNHLRRRREKIFGPAPSHPLDGNAKARIWAAAAAYNARNRQEGQHQGPLTWATLRVLRTLLWRFHGADGGGRCFPRYEKIAAVARCARSSVAIAIRALEDAGLLDWMHRITRIRRYESDLLGRMRPVWQVVRLSNSYRFIDPISRESGRKAYKSENPTRPQNQDLKQEGARLVGARVMSEEPRRLPSEETEPPLAPQWEHAAGGGARLSATERAAIVARMDAGTATKADWAAWAANL
jgi:hypothetical protein